MRFQFKCAQCGKEIEVTMKIVIASHLVKLPKDIENAKIMIECPNCGKKGAVSIKPGDVLPVPDHLTRLKFKSARNPCMN